MVRVNDKSKRLDAFNAGDERVEIRGVDKSAPSH